MPNKRKHPSGPSTQQRRQETAADINTLQNVRPALRTNAEEAPIPTRLLHPADAVNPSMLWERTRRNPSPAPRLQKTKGIGILFRIKRKADNQHSSNESKMDRRLAAAIARGELVRQQLAADEGGSLSTAQAARLLGVFSKTVQRRWRNHRLVAWKHGRCLRVPVWQFAGRELLNGIEQTLQIFASDDQWRVMCYFLGTRLSLGNRRPLDLLRGGKVAEVIAHAKVYGAENTW